ncbi:MAG: 1-(5-phosphoribosyl)-5-((5-phosphoribosylamino)methylideneamino)imidazole-4-carboxamide isomerase [Porticoccaceae bacterium]|nr:1-(5-phosphoribosyl)-5-((5-phosphoribosylamino)methylideneamino)imidazole-4-carboxamide isomerase [Porticoccaceae bacterium]|tara:strand:- start:44 stop:427 length:384 start_codon:yes stop_codon:yes gene_type:complete
MSEFKPEKIIVSKAKDKLTLVYKMRDQISLSAEYLRVYSPSAEVRGHYPSDHVLQYGKKNVRIINVKKVGLYAIQLVFDDGHDSGIYSWDYIFSLKKNHKAYWKDYLLLLAKASQSRLPDTQILELK